MKTAIYCLSDPRTGYVRYVGKANDPNRRGIQHQKRQSSEGMKQWVSELLISGVFPVLDVIEWADENEWRDCEKFWIAYFRSYGDRLLNISDGGDGVFAHTIGIRKKISRSSKNRVVSEETLARRSASLTGKKRGPMNSEWRTKISIAMKGVPKGCAHRLAVINAITGKKRTPEQCAKFSEIRRAEMTPEKRAKISLALTGKKLSKETKEKLSAAHAGKVFTAEHRDAISASAKLRQSKRRGEILSTLRLPAVDEFMRLLA